MCIEANTKLVKEDIVSVKNYIKWRKWANWNHTHKCQKPSIRSFYHLQSSNKYSQGYY